jgi:hypothetical protein
MLLYQILTNGCAIIISGLFAVYAHYKIYQKAKIASAEAMMHVDPFVPTAQIFIIGLGAVGILLAVKFGLGKYIESPVMYQITSPTKTYVVDSYSRSGQINFKCGDREIFLGEAIVSEVPRIKEQKAGFQYCK